MLLACALCGLVAPVAAANPGSAILMTMVHIVVGNIIIGAIEAVVACRFGARWYAVPVLIVGNYASAIVGVICAGAVFTELVHWLGADPLADALPASWLTVIALAVLGLVVEVPVYTLAFAGSKQRSAKNVLWSLLIANLATNALLVLWYSQVWETSLAERTRVVAEPGDVFDGSVPAETWVYMIGQDQRSIHRCRLDGSEDQIVTETSRPVPWGRLGVYSMPGQAPHLCLVDSGGPVGLPEYQPESGLEHREWDDRFYLVELLPVGSQATTYDQEQVTLPYLSTYATAPYGPAADLREGEPPFKVESSWEGLRGLTITYADREVRLALDNPLIRRSMTPFSVTVLPGDLVVFELSREGDPSPWGTYVLDVESGRVARLATGRSPVVVIRPDPRP